MATVPHQVKICDDCGVEKQLKQFHGGNAVRCATCSQVLEDAKVKAATAARRKKRLDMEAAKALRLKQKRSKKSQAKTKVRTRKEKERKEATARVTALDEAKKFTGAERTRLNVVKRELATRTLVKRHLLPFIVRHKPDYIPGWVHKDICAKLEKFAQDVQDKKSPRLMIQMPPRHGKILAHSTPMLTMNGWTTHGELSTGDLVFSPSGEPVEILALSDEGSSDVIVEFSDGSEIRCHENHEWEIFDRSSNNWKVVETNYFLSRKLVNKNRYNLQVRNTGPVDFNYKTLPIDPYFLGMWLGDGSRTDTSICYASVDCQPIEEIKRRGFVPSTEYTHKGTGVEYIHFAHQGVIQSLKKLGCAPDKHIPDLYLQSSIDQRLDLLAGLIDSDGHVERKTGRVRIATCDKRLADTIFGLTTGFGFQPYITEQQPCLSTSGIQGRKVVYYIGFQPTMDIPTKIPRKRIKRLAKQRHRAIVSARLEPNGEKGRCIQVDSENGLYLAGRNLIPTHNSEIASVNFPAWYLGNNPNHEIILSSYASSLAEEFSKKVRALVRSDEYKMVFDKTRLDPDNQNASGWRTTKSGGFVPAGVGGGITGKGAHCTHFSVAVSTKRGILPIYQVEVGDEVLGYDHETNVERWTEVKAISTQYKPELVNVGGAYVTPNHRVWSEAEGYVEAKDAKTSQLKLSQMQSGVQQSGERVQQEQETIRGRCKDILFPRMRECKEPKRSNVLLREQEGTPREELQSLLSERQACGFNMQPMLQGVQATPRRTCEERKATWRERTDILLSNLLRLTSYRIRTPHLIDGGVQNLRGETNKTQQPKVLRERVLRQSEGREDRLRKQLERPEEESSREGWTQMRKLWGGKEQNRGASHRPRRAEPRPEQPNPHVRALPQPLSSSVLGASAGDFKGLLQGQGGHWVVDLQTGTENFFAEGVLVHNCLIIDDPIKNMEEAESEVTQQKIWDWYSSTAYTRLAPGGGVLIIQTRWTDVDLSGRLEHEMREGNGDSWEIVRYPAVATQNETFRRKGDPLHEERYDAKALARIKNAVGPRVWDALYQQNPVAEEGGYFTRDAIKWYDGDPPLRLHNYAAWDLAIGKGDRNDFTVGIVVGIDEDDNMWIVDMRRGRWDSFEIVEQIMDVHYEHRPYISGIEKGQIQMAIGPYLEQRITEERAYDMVVQDLPTGRRDKEARARAIQGRIRQGKVFFPRDKPWVDDLVQEMLRFPHGAHDDCVDAIAWIGLMLQDMNHPLEVAYRQDKDFNGWRVKILRTLPGLKGRKKSMMSS